MTSILLLKETIYYNSFRCKYFFSKKYFLSFFFFVVAFLKFRLNFNHFQKKDDPHSWSIFELTDSEKRS